MKRILIFRTDRVGDFLITSPIISSLKRNYPNIKIDIVCSDFNYHFIKTFNIFNKVFLYPKLFLKKIIFFINLPSYDLVFVMDGKKRSIYISLLKLCKIKLLLTPSFFFKKNLSFFFRKIYLIKYDLPKIDLIKKIINDLNCDYLESDINFLKVHENTSSLDYKFNYKNFILLNFDEKWIFKNYLNSYSNIEPNFEEFLIFLEKLSKKNKKIVITNGFKENYILKNLSSSDFFKKKNNVILKNNIDIFELQFLIKNSEIVITCHGAPSHIASNYNKKIIDIIDLSEKSFFESYNFHFKNKTQIIRKNFKDTSEEILDSI